MKSKLSELNNCPTTRIVAVCAPFFEGSPWIAERTTNKRPFAGRSELHRALCDNVETAPVAKQIDLVGRIQTWRETLLNIARSATNPILNRLFAGLTGLQAEEARQFCELNAAYRTKFDFNGLTFREPLHYDGLGIRVRCAAAGIVVRLTERHASHNR